MRFSENITTDTLVNDLAEANPDNVLLSAQLFCFFKVLAADLKHGPQHVDQKYLEQAWKRAAHSRPARVIQTINSCRKNINQGHKLSRGHPHDKPKGLPFFTRAMDDLRDLGNVKEFPFWLLIPLITEVKAREGSLFFYCKQYAEANKRFASAEYELEQIMSSSDWPFQGIYDKEITLRGYHLSSFLVYSLKKRFDIDKIKGILSANFDSRTTEAVETGLKMGHSHSKNYVAPLSKWIRQKVNSGALSTVKLPYDVGEELFLCDRYEYFRSCATYIANRAWIDLYLYFSTADDRYLVDGRRRYNLSMNAMIEGAVNRDCQYYYVSPDAAKTYCLDSSVHVKEAQIILSRNLFYRMLFSQISGERQELANDVHWLTALYNKDCVGSPEKASVTDSLATGFSNVSQIGLESTALALVKKMPPRLRTELLAKVA
jgi:hypothetical protein